MGWEGWGEVTTPHSHRVTPSEVSNTSCVKGGWWGWGGKAGERIQLPIHIESLLVKSQTPAAQRVGVGGGGGLARGYNSSPLTSRHSP